MDKKKSLHEVILELMEIKVKCVPADIQAETSLMEFGTIFLKSDIPDIEMRKEIANSINNMAKSISKESTDTFSVKNYLIVLAEKIKNQ